jgi:hypothetical protein
VVTGGSDTGASGTNEKEDIMLRYRHAALGRIAWRVVALAALVALGGPHPAGAQAGDGVCQPAEAQKAQCAILGTNLLEVVLSNQAFPVTGTCQIPGGPVACSFWPYRFSGPVGDNTLTVLIPAGLDVYSNQLYPPTSIVYTGCQQLYAPGQGDPTGFGKGIVTHKACRVAFNIDVGPGTPNLVLATSVAQAAATSTQLKAGKSFYFDDIQGAGTTIVPRLATTMEEITTVEGITLTVETNQVGGLVSATASSGPVTIIPPGFAVLCTPFDPTNPYPLNFPGQYDCGPVVENLDGTSLQAGENSTCYYRRSDGTLLKYNC